MTSTDIQANDTVSVKFATNREEVNYDCLVVEPDGETLWLQVPKEVVMFMDLAVGTPLQIIRTDATAALCANSSVKAMRTDGRAKQVGVEMPNDWCLLRRRTSPRIRVDMEVFVSKLEDVAAKNDKPVPGRITDLSAYGARVHARSRMRLGRFVVIGFPLPDGGIPVVGVAKVVRLVGSGETRGIGAPEDSHDFGVQFVKLSQADKERIERFIKVSIKKSAAA